MRTGLLNIPLLSVLLSLTTTTAFPFLPAPIKPEQKALAPSMSHQGPGPILPVTDTSPEDDGNSGFVSISDVLGRDRSISIFASLARDVASVADRLENAGMNATVLAPTNAALAMLPRKPWEDAADYQALGSNAYNGAAGEDRAQRNLERFIEAHVVPSSPWMNGEKAKALAGNTVWIEEKEGKKFIQPDNVEVQTVVDKVANGELWIIKGVLNYAA